ncbi:rhombosortase [Burkholderia alba]|uniref:rhombosortase n=1 Tax=Burkholderia alba TaxID=2683677 RepID=UPI002B056706|nr:rhombosortase [Burkholderia alba]
MPFLSGSPPYRVVPLLARRYAGWLAVAALLVALQCLPAPVRDALAYDRRAIAGGEIWRIATAHFVHLGWAHCIVNVACLALCACLLAGRCRPFVTIGALAAGCGLLLWIGAPEVSRYVGLSGVIYGLAVMALLPHARRERLAGLVLLALFVRVGWQLVAGTPRAEADWLGGPVIAQGHVAGLAAGAAFAWVGARRRAGASRRAAEAAVRCAALSASPGAHGGGPSVAGLPTTPRDPG